MRDVLKNFFSNQIILEDNSQFYYTITPYELTNNLGNIIDVLQQYNFTKKADNNGKYSANYKRQKKLIGMILKRQK